MSYEKYEISIWDDVFIPEKKSGDTLITPAHYEDEKVAVIGSNTMTAACRAYDPKLVSNINGTNTLTFKMYYVYTDETTGEKLTNPFLDLLVNERKIKLYWHEKWYDFVIKNIQEDSNGKSITYTCKDLFMNELSKNGFNLEFDNELGNNLDTIDVLAERILDGSDWKLDKTKTEDIIQTTEEALYVGIIDRTITATDEYTNEKYSIPIGSTVLIFYSEVINAQHGYFQFLYYPGENNSNIDAWPHEQNSTLIVDVPCCYITDVHWDNDIPDFLSEIGDYPIPNHRGTRLVRSQKTVFDSRIGTDGRYVKVYNRIGNKNSLIYGYDSTEYKDATFVNNLFVNSKNFANTTGWLNVGSYRLYPEYNANSAADYVANSYLFIPWYNDRITKIYNAGLRESRSFIPDGMQKGDKFIFRFITRVNNVSNNTPKNEYHHTTVSLKPHIYEYDINTMLPVSGATDYLSCTVTSKGSSGDDTTKPCWLEYTCTCQKSFSYNQIYDKKLGFFVEQLNNSGCWLEQVEFFPYVKSDDGVRINPGEMDKNSVATVYHHFYDPNKASNKDTIQEFEFVSVEDTMSGIEPVFNDNPFVKMRSITAKQSNRFNLLQQLAETFQCWCVFDIEHYLENDGSGKTPGKIKYEGAEPIKRVYFKNEIGQETGIGFIYGIDLKTISRTIQSDQIVTKTIVSPNNNEFGINGFCTIARSENNYTRDTFILNFDYYIQHGLLDRDQLYRDLYNYFQWIKTDDYPKGGSLTKGYYTQLRELNIRYDNLTELLVNRRTELEKMKAYQKLYTDSISSTEMEIEYLKNDITSYARGSSFTDKTTSDFIKAHKDDPEIVSRLNSVTNQTNNLKSLKSALKSLDTSIDKLQKDIDNQTKQQEEIIKQIKILNLVFYKRYSRFIQEGSWIDENYNSDDLYYFDAQNVSYTSSRPQVSYNISVARLSSLEEFKTKVFNLGDITFVQDTEFFGYVYIDGVKTPYKEKVLISEVTFNLDAPDKDSFKVQNYKTQFEDLFQRVAATTQTLQYAAGEYARAANAIASNGTIKTSILQDSINANNNLVIQAYNELVVQDSTGLTVTSATDPNRRTKVTSGGVFVSSDGGANWKSAINSNGISTQLLTAGVIKTNEINLVDGQYPTFKWDSRGINAYNYSVDENNDITQGDTTRGVRFDRYGLYGLDGVATDVSTFRPATEEEVWEKAPFGMTWKGFFLKHTDKNHMVSINSSDDIQILVKGEDKTNWNNAQERVKLGRLGADNYGLRLRDGEGNTTLETESNGTLWLKDQLNISTTRYSDYNIRIGYLPLVTDEDEQIKYQNKTNLDRENIHRAIDVNQKMVVWEDGTLYAKDGYFEGTVNAKDGQFTGTIYATGGQIGNMSIDAIENMFEYHVEISSSGGKVIKKDSQDSITLTAQLYLGLDKVEDGDFTYQWYRGNSELSSKRTKTLVIDSKDLSDELTTYSCKVTYIEPSGENE